MILTIDRGSANHLASGSDMLLRAADALGTAVTIALSLSAWRSLEGDASCDSIMEVEQMALTGNWQPYGAGRVWRVTLI